MIRTPYFSIRMKKNTVGTARLGVVAGKAAAKTAVARNFLKRQARVSLATVLAPGTDILVVFTAASRTLTAHALRNALRETVARAQS